MTISTIKASTKTLLTRTALAVAITLSTLNAHAALYNRGNGMIYDSTQNITWLQDANWSKTSGYDADGAMTWQGAFNWADTLVFGGYSDWRLASAGLNGTNYPCSGSYASCPGYYNGANDYSYNNTRSEIGHLFAELGNKANRSTTNVYQPGFGWTNSAFTDAGTNQAASFLNVQNSTYWEAEAYAPFPTAAWIFYSYLGLQQGYGKDNNAFAWAVRAGDVPQYVEPPAPVPVPAAAWLMGSGLIGLAGLARRKK